MVTVGGTRTGCLHHPGRRPYSLFSFLSPANRLNRTDGRSRHLLFLGPGKGFWGQLLLRRPIPGAARDARPSWAFSLHRTWWNLGSGPHWAGRLRCLRFARPPFGGGEVRKRPTAGTQGPRVCAADGWFATAPIWSNSAHHDVPPSHASGPSAGLVTNQPRERRRSRQDATN